MVSFYSYLALLVYSTSSSALRVQPHQIQDLFFNYSPEIQGSERGWLWNWWGADSSVSIVDRTPPLTFIARPASFGKDLESPLLGYVIPLDSFTKPCPNDSISSSSPSHPIDTPYNLGCPVLCLDGPHEPEPTESWIALVQRGGCQFVEKTREAQRLGAKAIVVGGDNPDIYGNPDTLVNMYSPEDASDVKITATYIRYSDYIQLYSLIAASNTSHAGLRTLSLLLSTEHTAWEWYSPILTFVVILLLPSLLTLITLLVHRVRASRAAQRDRAPEDIVKNLPWRVWDGKKWEKNAATGNPPVPNIDEEVDLEQGTSQHLPWFETQLECAICLEEFAKGDRVRVLPCEHIFHVDEIDDWLINRKKLCPVCKADVTQEQPSYQPHQSPPLLRSSSPSQFGTDSPNSDTPTERTPLLRPDTTSLHE